MTNKEMVTNFISYIATSKEKDSLKQLNTNQELNSFLKTFWLKRDPTPLTPENEFKDEHLKRFMWANEKLGGWQTDQGRVHILYGKPDNILYQEMKFPGSSEKQMNKNMFEEIKGLDKFIEIWVYDNKITHTEMQNIFSNIEPGKIKFVFLDKMGFGVKEQIFSTEHNEKSEAWVYRHDLY